MSTNEPSIRPAVPQKLEVLVLPVSDFERAAAFYTKLGWRKDVDLKDGARRLLQFTPPGSSCSVMFGSDTTPSAPGTSQFVHLAVSDLVAAHADLIARGVETSDIYHAANGGYDPYNPAVRVGGLHPQRDSYRSFVTFEDPDGNGWLLQEITVRKEGRLDPTGLIFVSATDLANALRRASVAHGEHEKRTSGRDANWADWYANYLVAEHAGTPLPV